MAYLLSLFLLLLSSLLTSPLVKKKLHNMSLVMMRCLSVPSSRR
jgi:hypothetical protein